MPGGGVQTDSLARGHGFHPGQTFGCVAPGRGRLHLRHRCDAELDRPRGKPGKEGLEGSAPGGEVRHQDRASPAAGERERSDRAGAWLREHSPTVGRGGRV